MRSAVLGVWVVAFVLCGACGQGGFSKRVRAGKEGVFRYPIVTNPTTLDPGIVQDGDTIDLIQLVFEGLVTWGEDNQVHPLLAESWEVEDAGRRFVFKIKRGVKFHSGRELTAHDFKWTWERNTDPAFQTSTAETYLGDIVGVKEKVAGKAQEIVGVKVLDDYTLSVTIDKPRPYFLGKLTYIVSAVVDRESAPKKFRDRNGDWRWPEIRSADEMVGTGPFVTHRYVPDQIVVLHANKDYHGGAPLIEQIERPILKDAATRLNKYRAGELDLVMLERQDVEGIQSDPELRNDLRFFPRPSLYYIGLNMTDPPKGVREFKDRRVRRAFAMALDKERICKEYLGGINPVANGILPPGVLGHRPDYKGVPFDPEQARRLLAEAGFPGGRGFPELTMYFREARPDIRLVAEAAAGMLKENLGINVKLQSMEWRAYLEKHNVDAVPLFHMRWAADYLDPENFLSFLLASYGPENHVGYRNPRFDALCAEADSVLDSDRRLRLYHEAEDIVVQDAPFIPLYFQRDAELIHPRVKGLRESMFGHLPHTTVRLEGAG